MTPYEEFPQIYWTNVALLLLSLLLSAATLIFGLASWILISQWRTFKNYVFLNLIFMIAVVCICFYLVGNADISCSLLVAYVMSLIITSRWMLVATVMFYIDIVKVFTADVERKYLYTNIFVWLVPPFETVAVFTTAIKYYENEEIIQYYTISVVVVTLLAAILFYIKVLYTLVLSILEPMTRHTETKRNIVQKIILSTAACITSGITSFLPVMLGDIIFHDYIIGNVTRLVSLLNIIGIIVFYLAMKDHREAWVEYRRRRRAQLA